MVEAPPTLKQGAVNTVANASVIPSTSLIAVPGSSVSQQIHAFKIGLNYKFGPNGPPFPNGDGTPMAWVTWPGFFGPSVVRE
jgi:hypothetical protein